ncbi:hypothetical protein ABL57_09260 [Kocuria sp. SM24M-10]|nr:hypothetical protein ABL57_09260 [Kocuria sp. SM24M-10]
MRLQVLYGIPFVWLLIMVPILGMNFAPGWTSLQRKLFFCPDTHPDFAFTFHALDVPPHPTCTWYRPPLFKEYS